MASLTIRNLDKSLKERLRVRAARHGHSMEEEARVILRTSLAPKKKKAKSMADVFRECFGPERGFDLEIPKREPMPEPREFGE